MMEIVKMDPTEKYVLVIPDATEAQAVRILAGLEELKKQDGGLCVIHGLHATIVPASQVVGYKVLE